MSDHLPIRVLGIGSVHGDDQFGWLAAERLRQSWLFQEQYAPHVEVTCCRTPLDGFLEYASTSRALIVLDAVVSGSSAGSLLRLEEADLPSVQSAYSSHGQGVVQMIALGRAMNMLPVHVVVLAAELGESFSYSQPGETLVQALDAIEPLVIAELESLL